MFVLCGSTNVIRFAFSPTLARHENLQQETPIPRRADYTQWIQKSRVPLSLPSPLSSFDLVGRVRFFGPTVAPTPPNSFNFDTY